MSAEILAVRVQREQAEEIMGHHRNMAGPGFRFRLLSRMVRAGGASVLVWVVVRTPSPGSAA